MVQLEGIIGKLKRTGFGGWLILLAIFLLYSTLSKLTSFMTDFLRFIIEPSRGQSIAFYGIGLILMVGLALLLLFTAYALINKLSLFTPLVIVALAYDTLLGLIIPAMGLVAGNSSQKTASLLGVLIVHLPPAIIGTTYMLNSKRVKNTYVNTFNFPPLNTES